MHIRSLLLLSVVLAAASPVSFAETESASSELLAKCKRPPKPAIPNGRTSTEEDLLAAQRTVKAYMADSNTYRGCLDQIQLGWGEAATPEQRAVYEIFYNTSVDEETQTGELFNQAVRAFKGARQ
jgi:hypothetical protein